MWCACVPCSPQVFWVGPVTGALMAGLTYQYVFDQGRVLADAAQAETAKSGQPSETEASTLLNSNVWRETGRDSRFEKTPGGEREAVDLVTLEKAQC